VEHNHGGREDIYFGWEQPEELLRHLLAFFKEG
jgi:hypothetical protein